MKALSTPQVREQIRRWLVNPNDLAGRKAVRKVLPKGESVHKTIVAVLGVANWPAAMKMRKAERAAAKAAKQPAKQSKKVAVKQVKKPAPSREVRLAKAA